MAALSSEERKFEEEVEQEVEEETVVKWASHYSSLQQILLVGEGDFSFSLCLANAFGSASNIVATSLDSHGHFSYSLSNLLSTFIYIHMDECNRATI